MLGQEVAGKFWGLTWQGMGERLGLRLEPLSDTWLDNISSNDHVCGLVGTHTEAGLGTASKALGLDTLGGEGQGEFSEQNCCKSKHIRLRSGRLVRCGAKPLTAVLMFRYFFWSQQDQITAGIYFLRLPFWDPMIPIAAWILCEHLELEGDAEQCIQQDAGSSCMMRNLSKDHHGPC